VAEAVAAGWYFYQMPAKEKAWCGYCVSGALANLAIAANYSQSTRGNFRLVE
jgi:hypothetical protein